MRSTSCAFAVLGVSLLLAAPAAPAAAQRGPRVSIAKAIMARDSAKATTRYDDTFRKYTKRQFGPGFDWTLFKAQAMAESDLNPNAKSRVGARGLMQLMPSTYRLISTRRPEFGAINDPEWNIAAGIMHDRYLYKLYEKDIGDQERMRFVFASYNAGEGTIARASAAARAKALDHALWSNIETIAPTVPRWRYRETLGYVRRINENHHGLSRRHP